MPPLPFSFPERIPGNGVGAVLEEEVPAWMWDEAQTALPVRELQLTEERVVVQVYALARCGPGIPQCGCQQQTDFLHILK